jgi:predicted RNA-binding protein with TRAM domain
MYGNEGGFRPRGGFAPVKPGDELDVKIEAVGEKGDGIAKKDGFVLFVPGGKEGDEVHIRVTKVLRRVGFAEIIGEASEAPAEETAPTEKTPTEPATEESAGEEAQDTEDFGEEESDKQ